MTLTPAYGRDYKTEEEALAAFHAGKEFYGISVAGKFAGSHEGYTTKAEIIALGIKRVSIRYCKKTEQVIVNL